MEKDMEKVLAKAEVLIEALPYIQRFNRKIIVVKYGGSAMSNEELQKNVIKDVALLKLVGFKPIIVHGGGKEISRWVGKVGKEAKFVNGLRVTDEETMEIAEMVLNKVNKSLVTMVQELGVKAVGISGKDGGLLQVEKKYSDGQDIGYVGEVTGVNPKVLYDLLEKDFLPIVAPIGLDENFQTYTDQNHTAQYLRFACQLYSEFTANEQPSNTDKKCDSCNDQGTDQSHQPVIFSNRKSYGQCVNGCGYPLDHQYPEAHAGFLLLTVPWTDTLIDHMSADIAQQDKCDPRNKFFKC